MSIEVQALIDAVISHAQVSGYFGHVAAHEPKNAPGSADLTFTVWQQSLVPIAAASGLNKTTARLLMNVRLYTPAFPDDPDRLDPKMVEATDDLMRRYSADFTLDGLVKNVDLLGQYGIPMTAQAAYLQIADTKFRIMTIQLPLIVNDLWTQVA